MMAAIRRLILVSHSLCRDARAVRCAVLTRTVVVPGKSWEPPIMVNGQEMYRQHPPDHAAHSLCSC